jgi:hypothetical protein
MKHLVIALLLAVTVQAQTVVQRVGEDAIAIDRVAAASKKDLPRDLLKRIIEEDIDLLRGKRNDGTYEYASFERFDSGRIAQDFSVQYRKDKMDVLEVKGAFVYRVQVEVPSRRLLVRRNRPVWIERVDLEYLPERGSQSARQSIEVKQWLKPGEFRPVDLPEVARQATVRVVATVEEKSGYGNVEISLIKARIVDNADSPYGDAVASAKAIQRGLENNDVPSIRAMAQRLRHGLEGGQVGREPAVPVEMSRPAPVSADPQMREELQQIEDLLTGTEPERREGMDRLHQLIRRLRQ